LRIDRTRTQSRFADHLRCESGCVPNRPARVRFAEYRGLWLEWKARPLTWTRRAGVCSSTSGREQGVRMRRRTVIVTCAALAILALALLLTVVACTSSRKPASSPAPTTATSTTTKAPAAVAPTPPAAGTTTPTAGASTAAAPVSAAPSPAAPAPGAPPAVTATAVTTPPAAAPTETAPAVTPAAVVPPPASAAVPVPAGQPAAEAAAPAATAPVVESPAPKAVVPALDAGTAVQTSPIVATAAAVPSPATPAAPAVDAAKAQGDQAVAASDAPFAQSVDVLAGLQSYRYVTVFSFTGQADGELESGSIEMRGAVAGSDRQMVTWRDLQSGEEFGIIRIGDEAWMQEGETWTPVPTMVAELMSQAVVVFAPSTSWAELAEGVGTTSTYVGTEMVNGVPARHYASTYSDWMQSEDVNVAEASGDVWMAEAGYPVRYRFTAKAIDEEGYEGSALWTMELSDVNGPVTIEAPQVVEDSGE
jgi:hypothetical protein